MRTGLAKQSIGSVMEGSPPGTMHNARVNSASGALPTPWQGGLPLSPGERVEDRQSGPIGDSRAGFEEPVATHCWSSGSRLTKKSS